MDINYPLECNTHAKKYACLYRAQERMRLLHNKKGKKYRDGELTEQQWNSFLEWWKPRQDCITDHILIYRNYLKNKTTWDKYLTPEDFFVV